VDSEVSRFDGSPGEDLREILAICDEYERLSGGAFTAFSAGRALDPGAVVKGWAVQRAAELLRSAGVGRFCVNAGGDVVTAGGPWRVGIRHPDQAGKVCAVLDSRDGAVATSAAYERGAHILDGRTGEPAAGLLSVTVVAANLTTADATATAAFAMGVEGIEWANARPGCEVFIVDEDRRVHRSEGLALL
jgi:thiamine biosynthesis lipoprotein